MLWDVLLRLMRSMRASRKYAIDQNNVKNGTKNRGCFNKGWYVRIIIKVQVQPLYIKFLRS